MKFTFLATLSLILVLGLKAPAFADDAATPPTPPAPGLAPGPADSAAAPAPGVAPVTADSTTTPAPIVTPSTATPAAGDDTKAPSPAVMAPATAPNNSGIFIGIEAGPFWLQNFSVSSGDLGINYRFKNGWGLNVPLGYQFDNGLSVSFSIGYDNNDFQQLTGSYEGHSQGAATNGSVHLLPILFNVGYKLQIVGGLNWYIGAGVGAAYTDTSFTSFDDSGERSITFGELGQTGSHPTAVLGGLDNSSWNFAFEAFTGLGYDFTPNIGVQVGYRYTRVNDSFTVNGSSGGAFNGSSVELGVTFKF